MATKHKCIRDCYYIERLWRVGEILEETPGFEDAPPNKHFAAIGSAKAQDGEGEKRAKTSGDDKRSTDELRRVLTEDYGVEVKDGLPRKKIFAMLMPLEEAADKDVAGNPMTTTVHKTGGAADPKLPQQKVSQLSPDELDKTKNKDLAAMILRDRGVEVKYQGRSKADLFDDDLRLAGSQTAG